jgi:hypothetical protein
MFQDTISMLEGELSIRYPPWAPAWAMLDVQPTGCWLLATGYWQLIGYVLAVLVGDCRERCNE